MGNFNENKKFHFIYKTTNLLNNKFYIGMHSTSNLNDGYLGSGKKLKYSLQKYGIENFKCEIIEYYNDRKSLADRERELVNKNLLKDIMCMNLIIGGEGGRGFTIKEQRENARKSNEKQKKLRDTNPEWVKRRSERISVGNLKAYESGKKIKRQPCDWTGKKHSKNTIQKLKGHTRQKKELNSQFGSCWITNGIENKKIKKNDFENYLNNNWNQGRSKIGNVGNNQHTDKKNIICN